MSAKTNAEVVIDGKVYTLSGYENEEYFTEGCGIHQQQDCRV